MISAFPLLLEQTYLPAEEEKTRKTLQLVAMLRNRVKLYKFSFNNYAEDSFRVSYNMLVEQNKD